MRRKRQYVWIACCAILLNVLAPSVSHALAWMHGAPALMEVCSASGTKWVAPDLAAADEVSADRALHHLKHCPFCLTHAGSFALPTALAMRLPVASQARQSPPRYHSPTPLLPWSGANPRAPPGA